VLGVMEMARLMDNKWPRKRISVGVILFNELGNILLVNPIYRDGWLVPGGIVEEGESPLDACYREVLEELSISMNSDLILTCIDYTSSCDKYSEGVNLLFSGGVLPKNVIEDIDIDRGEINEFGFFVVSDAQKILVDTLSKRLAVVASEESHRSCVYLENGKLISC